jgi:hypothetical protein
LIAASIKAVSHPWMAMFQSFIADLYVATPITTTKQIMMAMAQILFYFEMAGSSFM